LSILDREFLEDYNQREEEEYEKLCRRVQEGEFDFDKDRYPPDERFVNLQTPVTDMTLSGCTSESRWFQVPFNGSTIFLVPAFSPSMFEEYFFKISQISEVINFINETGRVQIALQEPSMNYEGLDYLDPFFKELRPPQIVGLPYFFIGAYKEIQKAIDSFHTLGRLNFLNYLELNLKALREYTFRYVVREMAYTYAFLKLRRYAIVEDLENAIVDDPRRALVLFAMCMNFISDPANNLRFDLITWSLQDTRALRLLPKVYQPQEIMFPCEIGKFLVKKLTYAPAGLRACYDLIDHYDGYDLRKVAESLNDAIAENHPDIIKKRAEEFSEILDNVWNDPLIPKQTKNIIKGIPISIAAIGTAVSAYTGDLTGFLAGLGFSVGAKFLEANIEGLSEKIAKFFARSYQANVYDFKKKYKNRIVHTKKTKQD